MRRLTVSVSIVLVGVTFSALPGHSGAATGGPTLATQGCGPGVQRPTSITFFCGDGGAGITKLRWSRWGGALAVGRGTYYEKTCVPYCAAGGTIQRRATIRLTRRRVCPGTTHRYYRTANVSFDGGGGRQWSVPCPF